MTKSNLPTLAESQGDICYDDEDYDKSFTPQPMENTITTETIKDLSIEIACLLDEPCEVTEQDLIKLQDLITKLDNQ